MDLGECTKIHDLALRADYEIASKERDLFFELDVSDILPEIIQMCCNHNNTCVTGVSGWVGRFALQELYTCCHFFSIEVKQ